MQSLYRTAALLSALDDAKVFQVLAFLQKKSPRTKKAHWNEIFLMKHSIHLCFHEMFMEHFILQIDNLENYLPVSEHKH